MKFPAFSTKLTGPRVPLAGVGETVRTTGSRRHANFETTWVCQGCVEYFIALWAAPILAAWLKDWNTLEAQILELTEGSACLELRRYQALRLC